MLVRPSALVHSVIGSAIEVHKVLGPGLLESAYEACLVQELTVRGIQYRRQAQVPVNYKGTLVDCGYRADLIVEDEINFNVRRLVDGLKNVLR